MWLATPHPKPAYRGVSHEHLGPATVHWGWCGLSWCLSQGWQRVEDVLEEGLQRGLLRVWRRFWGTETEVP